MKIEAVFLDIDSTLLTDERTISKNTLDLLHKIQKDGVRVILVSGRTTRGMLHVGEEVYVGNHEHYIISYNGAEIVRFEDEETVYKNHLSHDLTLEILEHAKNFDIYPYIADGDTTFYPEGHDGHVMMDGKKFEALDHEAESGFFKTKAISDITSIVKDGLPKILFAGDCDYLLEIYEDLSEPFNDRTQNFFTARFYYEFTNKGVSKGNTIIPLLDKLGIPIENTIAFGDSGNDISMLQNCGLGIAMENASDEVKEIADDITLDNNSDGIYHYLKKFF